VAAELEMLLGASTTTVAIPNEEEILSFLNSTEGRKEIEDALRALGELGVHSIPKFIIEGSMIVDGAAHSDVFVEIFRDIERRGTIRNGPVFGKILGVPEEIIQRGSHTVETLEAA